MGPDVRTWGWTCAPLALDTPADGARDLRHVTKASTAPGHQQDGAGGGAGGGGAGEQRGPQALPGGEGLPRGHLTCCCPCFPTCLPSHVPVPVQRAHKHPWN